MFAACVDVQGVTHWPEANGQYIQDDSLAVCDGDASKPRYRQTGGTGFLFSDGTRWYGTTAICIKSWSYRQFSATASSSSPDQVTGNWRMVNTARDGMVSAPELTVKACGKLLD